MTRKPVQYFDSPDFGKLYITFDNGNEGISNVKAYDDDLDEVYLSKGDIAEIIDQLS